MVLCILAGNFDPLIFVGVMPLGTWRIFVNQLTSFLCQFFINEITASDAGPDIIRSHLFFSWEQSLVSLMQVKLVDVTSLGRLHSISLVKS